MIATVVEILTMTGIDKDAGIEQLSEFEIEIRRRVWTLLYIWDWCAEHSDFETPADHLSGKCQPGSEGQISSIKKISHSSFRASDWTSPP